MNERRAGKTAETSPFESCSMKIALLVTLLALSTEAHAAAAPIAEAPSLREQIKAERARIKADEENAPKARSWDRGADGRRPWDSSKEIPLTKE
jgi:hypothetical protein